MGVLVGVGEEPAFGSSCHLFALVGLAVLLLINGLGIERICARGDAGQKRQGDQNWGDDLHGALHCELEIERSLAPSDDSDVGIGLPCVQCKYGIFKMHLTHVRKSDLNLLPALAVLLEERSISKAAARHHLSQPAMSRVLQRLRETFADELLVRTAHGYELTARARRLQQDLLSVLPEVDRMLRGEIFNPLSAEDTFRVCGPDSASILIASRLPGRLKALAPGTQLELVAWHDKAFEDLTHGRVDVLLWANQVPQPLLVRELLEDDIICVVCERHPIGNRPLTKEAYLRYPHVLLTLFNPWGSIVDRVLAKNMQRRRIGLRVPYFGAAVLAVPGTDLIATLPRRSAEIYARSARVRISPIPFKVPRLRYLIAWHPSTNEEPALVWFRAQLVDIFTKLQ